MAATGGSEGLFRPFYEGCLSGCDGGIGRRPYHRNCGCALHKEGRNCSHANLKSMSLSYPIRKSWSEGNLALMASMHSSPSSSPATAPRCRLSSCNHADEENSVSCKL
ncbi:hypothetical protein ACJRO7_016644 [Eucalyptus globulus]|uniref:Uncharacterized protein n=1 Tax=Eucalyptus globulus TaxID=34317 RepID=A0ABD3LDE7_EUCGL